LVGALRQLFETFFLAIKTTGTGQIWILGRGLTQEAQDRQ